MDDEKVAYKGYEKFVKAGIKNVCVHKGLFAPPLDRQFPNLRAYADASDVGQAAKDWPQLNFIIYHGAYRHVGGDPKVALAEFEQTGRISWTSDLADILETYNVNNVYADVGQLFAMTLIAEPTVTAALIGTMIKNMGVDRVCWGTDAVWTGGPQWQIEGLRRFEIPEEMQKKYGFAPLGPATGPVKSAIFGLNNARLYGINPRKAELELKNDKLTALKAEYDKGGREPTTSATVMSPSRSPTSPCSAERRAAQSKRSGHFGKGAFLRSAAFLGVTATVHSTCTFAPLALAGPPQANGDRGQPLPPSFDRALVSRVDTDWQCFVALHEARIHALGFANYLDIVEAFQDFFPDDLELRSASRMPTQR